MLQRSKRTYSLEELAGRALKDVKIRKGDLFWELFSYCAKGSQGMLAYSEDWYPEGVNLEGGESVRGPYAQVAGVLRASNNGNKEYNYAIGLKLMPREGIIVEVTLYESQQHAPRKASPVLSNLPEGGLEGVHEQIKNYLALGVKSIIGRK